MTTYQGIYRAKAVAVDGARLICYVPQVFGDQPITISRYVSDRPTETGMGWVFFEGGLADHPVWTGATAIGSHDHDSRYVNIDGDTMTGPLTVNGGAAANLVTQGPINVNGVTGSYVQDLDIKGHAIIEKGAELTGAYDLLLSRDPTANLQAATKQYVDNRITPNEVWIGTSDPIAANPTIELWYDSGDTSLGFAYPNWTAVTAFQNSWANFDGVRTAQYRMIGDEVALRGVVKSGTVGYGTAVFTLPVGFRPASGRSEDWPVRASGGTAFVTVFDNGVVSVLDGSTSSATGYVYFNGVRFSVTG